MLKQAAVVASLLTMLGGVGAQGATLVLQQVGGTGNNGGDSAGPYQVGFTLGMPLVGDSGAAQVTVSFGFWSLIDGEMAPTPAPDSELPVASQIFQNYPNPLQSSTSLDFRIAADKSAGAVPVRLEVFDVAGRRIATLVDEAHAPGQYTVHWDGRDEFGREVASGVYFARFHSGETSKTVRMLRVR
jgi:hypothetical protein